MFSKRKGEIRILSPWEESAARILLEEDPIKNIWLIYCIKKYGLLNLGLPEHGTFYGYFKHDSLSSILYCNNLGFWRFHAGDVEETVSLIRQARSDGQPLASITGDPMVIDQIILEKRSNLNVGIVEYEVILKLQYEDYVPYPVENARIAEERDIDDMVELEIGLQMHLLGRSADREFLRQHILQLVKSGRAAVYSVGSRVVSKAEFEVEIEGLSQMSGVFTQPEYRNQGYALATCSLLCSLAFEENRMVCLETQRYNRQALSLYKKLGFRRHSYTTILRLNGIQKANPPHDLVK